jgi:two-component system sensor histidine kinase PilS (NtrC family)
VLRRNEVRVDLEEGRSLPLGVSPSILRGTEGIRGVVLIFQDLTEAKAMEEKIRRQDRLAVIGELSAGIAHELRNPLASISGSVEVLNESLQVDGEDQRLMKLVVNESSRINDIVEEFLNYARIQSVDRRSASLEALMQDVITLVRNHPSFGKGREVRCDLAGCPSILADTGQVKQVFLNLLLNALEAMEGSGEVVVRLPAEGQSRPMGPGLVEVWVQDDGPGIVAEEAVRVFEPFYTTKRGGTGLGLAVAQRIVESHDGRVLYAPPPDGRSTFRVYLPRGADAE